MQRKLENLTLALPDRDFGTSFRWNFRAWRPVTRVSVPQQNAELATNNLTSPY